MRLKDSGVDWLGEIPEGWKTFRQMDVSSEVKHVNARLQETNLLSLSYGNIVRKDIKSVTGLLPESFEGYNIIEPRDVVVRLTDLQNDHHSIRVARSCERGIITSAYITLRPNSLMDSGYFYYGLLAFDIRKELYGMGGGVRQSLNYDQFKRMMLPVPPVIEQLRIVAYLDEKTAAIDSRVAVLEQKLAAYKRLKASVINRAVTRGLDPKAKLKDSGVDWIGQVPEGWEVLTARNVFMEVKDKNTDGLYTRQLSFRYGRIVDKVGNSATSEADDEIATAYRIVHPNDIVINGLNLNFDFISQRVAIVENDGIITSAYLAVRAMEKMMLPRFAVYLFKAYDSRHIFHNEGSGLRKTLKFSDFKTMPTPCPKVSIQDEIVSYLDAECAKIDKMAELVTREIELYKKLKRSLINEVVTGKREVA